MRPLPIRQRLTLWYFLMFASAALALSLTSCWMLRSAIDASLGQDLRERVDDVHEQLKQHGPRISPDESQRRFDAIYKFRDDGKWLQIKNDQGEWIYRSARMIAAGAALQLPNALPVQGETSHLALGTRRILVFATALVVDGRRYSVETGISTNKSEALLHRFQIGLFVLTPGILLIALLAGHVMSRKALSPVTLIANEARRITEKNLTARLPVYETRDEIAHLSVTLNDMLVRIDKGFSSVRDFTANASHELRTPLARIRAEAEVALLAPRSPEEYRDSLEHLQQTAIEMGNMLESLLILARSDAGVDKTRLARISVEDLIAAAVQEWMPVAARLSIQLQSEVSNGDGPDRERIYVLADRMALMRLLRIWLDNACKFTPALGTILVTAKTMGKTVTLAVEDTGVGIPVEQQHRVFERFYRAHGDTSRIHRSAGLGLSLAARIAEQHKTTLKLESRVGKGTRIEMMLALAASEPEATALRTEPGAKGSLYSTTSTVGAND